MAVTAAILDLVSIDYLKNACINWSEFVFIVQHQRKFTATNLSRFTEIEVELSSLGVFAVPGTSLLKPEANLRMITPVYHGIVVLFQIEHLEDMVGDKEGQLQASKARLASLHADQSSSDSALSSLEESLSDREKQIER
jgi:hypothetical protein